MDPKKGLVRKCDAAWSKAVRARAKGKCEWCAKPANDAHHMVGRRRSAYLRHRLENGVALCQSCHFNFHSKESITGWTAFQKKRKKDFEFVTTKMNECIKVSVADLKEALTFLEETYDRH